MTSTEFLSRKPFNLDGAQITWVEQVFDAMSTDDKAAHLFNLLIRGSDDSTLDMLEQFRPGAITKPYGSDRETELNWMRRFEAGCAVPPLVSADLEGSRMSLAFGTKLPNPLGLAALDDIEATKETGRILAEEGRAAGITWSFTPVVDINATFRSAIVGTRGFGSDLKTIERHALALMHAFQDNGVAATVKHWPGEGYDDRDQHLVTTVNSLSMEEWEETYGRLYRKAIDEGVMSVMSAHIALPSFMRELDPDCGVEAFRPASINRALNITLLREQLGFNGVIVSDATPMAGFGSWGARAEMLPEVVSGGCDMILFSDDPWGDLETVRTAIADGRITPERLDDAVLRILGLKATQGLNENPVMPPKQAADTAFARAENVKAAAEMFAAMPTLVKDTGKTLPLDTNRHKRVLIYTNDITFPFLPEPLKFAMPQMLEKEGFEVTVFEPGMEIDPLSFDLHLYLLGDESLLTRSHIFIDWAKIGGDFGAAMQRFWHDVPTVMISFGHPYYLYDAPRVPTYINAYSTLEEVQLAVVDCLMGRAEFNTHSPVDPFCGEEQARY